MWLMTTDGFYSIRKNAARGDLMTVRARNRKDLLRLKRRLRRLAVLGRDPAADARIVYGAGTDYPFRMEVPRRYVQALAADLIGEIEYGNFKDAVRERLGKRYADVMGEIWAALLALEPRWIAGVKELGGAQAAGRSGKHGT